MKNGLNMIAAAALAFLQQGANQAALDAAAPHHKFSPRQRRKVVSYARSKMATLSPTQQAINKMTNWQRNQWGRAGYPMTPEKLEHFANLPHWKKARAA